MSPALPGVPARSWSRRGALGSAARYGFQGSDEYLAKTAGLSAKWANRAEIAERLGVEFCYGWTSRPPIALRRALGKARQKILVLRPSLILPLPEALSRRSLTW